MIEAKLKKMERVTIAPVEGAMYAFPRVHFSQKAIEEAKSRSMSVDLMYCLEMLDKTGVVTVPGSGFRQVKDTYHFRITSLILPEARLEERMDAVAKFNQEFHARFK
jgi:alanine transaminase